MQQHHGVHTFLAALNRATKVYSIMAAFASKHRLKTSCAAAGTATVNDAAHIP